MSNTVINNMIGWRNYASAQPTGNLTSNYSFSTDSASLFLQNVLTNSNGFLWTSWQTWTGGAGLGTDQAFMNRQELIKFRTVASAGISFVNALQYLGIFSRELNSPSWRPTQDASEMGGNNGPGGIYTYRTNADSSTAINRNLLGVRVTGPFTRADGIPAVVGEPLLKNRFSLTRIKHFRPMGNPNVIQRDFGLKWDNVNNRWNYVGATGSIVQPAIERLDQVAAENREPNFFEILKAAILSGSMGLGSGTATTSTFVASESKYYSTTNNLSGDYEIMQIGANIIDAWDPDNFPTSIYFANTELAGVENLPYLNKMVYDFWLSNHGNNGDRRRVERLACSVAMESTSKRCFGAFWSGCSFCHGKRFRDRVAGPW